MHTLEVPAATLESKLKALQVVLPSLYYLMELQSVILTQYGEQKGEA